MQDLKPYISIVPVLSILWFIFLVGILIEIIFFLDALICSF